MAHPYRDQNRDTRVKPVWWVEACIHPFYIGGPIYEISGPYRWRWWARLVAWSYQPWQEPRVTTSPPTERVISVEAIPDVDDRPPRKRP